MFLESRIQPLEVSVTAQEDVAAVSSDRLSRVETEIDKYHRASLAPAHSRFSDPINTNVSFNCFPSEASPLERMRCVEGFLVTNFVDYRTHMVEYILTFHFKTDGRR